MAMRSIVPARPACSKGVLRVLVRSGLVCDSLNQGALTIFALRTLGLRNLLNVCLESNDSDAFHVDMVEDSHLKISVGSKFASVLPANLNGFYDEFKEGAGESWKRAFVIVRW
jgi:hypothetical protein